MAKLTLDVAKEIAHSRGGKCISERYINCQMPMLWKCAKDHLWSARFSNVKNEKTWCPWCAVENRRTRTIEDMRKFAKKKGGLCLATEYINRRDPLEWQCKEGHKWKASAKDILKGTWCRTCNTPGRKRVIPSQKIIPVQGHIIPEQKRVIPSQKIILVQEHITPEQECTPIQRHDTQHRQRRFNIDIANNIAQERGGKCLSTEYVNTDTPMLWKCAKGHEWSTTLYRIKNMGRWCTQCAGNLPCGLSEAKEIAHSKGGMCLSREYTNLCVPMQWMCNKGHKWFASSIRRPDFLKIPEHPRGLELDIYYPQYGFA